MPVTYSRSPTGGGAAEHSGPADAGAAAQESASRLYGSGERDAEKQAVPGGGRVSADEADPIGIGGLHHAAIESLNLFRRAGRRNCNGHEHESGGAAHGGDIAQVGDGRPVSDVFIGGGGRVEVHTLSQEVRGDESPFVGRGLEDGRVIADSLEHLPVWSGGLRLQQPDQAELATDRTGPAGSA